MATPQHGSELVTNRRQRINVRFDRDSANTLYLQSRETARSIDIFEPDFTNHAGVLTGEVAADDQRDIPAQRTDWYNTETHTRIPGPIHREPASESLSQNARISVGRGVVIYMAQWNYTFASNSGRVMLRGSYGRRYELDGTVTHIHERICAQGDRLVNGATGIINRVGVIIAKWRTVFCGIA
jgi:hypothetical protein